MNEKKLKHLLASARQIPPATAPGGFAEDVARIARARSVETVSRDSFGDILAAWLPRVALACAAFAVLCVGGDLWLAPDGCPTISGGLAELSEQWLFPLQGV